MFERYTEKARRVIFFARYEASQYGSRYIETEHLLLGLMREDPSLVRRFLGPHSVATSIRSEIEKQITLRERISTSVEVPLSDECKKVLNFAGEEADRLAHKYIGTEHLLIALLRLDGSSKGSLAARVLHERGVKPETIREQLATSGPALVTARAPSSQKATTTLDSFLAGLKVYDWDQLSGFFAQNCQFIDATGKRWKGFAEIEKQFAVLFAPYAKKNVTFLLEGTDKGVGDSLVASVLWENVTFGHERKKSMHRMTIVLAPEGAEWAIWLIQVTPVVVL